MRSRLARCLLLAAAGMALLAAPASAAQPEATATPVTIAVSARGVHPRIAYARPGQTILVRNVDAGVRRIVGLTVPFDTGSLGPATGSRMYGFWGGSATAEIVLQQIGRYEYLSVGQRSRHRGMIVIKDI